VECAYAESRVGRVPGNRVKKRQEQSEQRQRTESEADRNSCITVANPSDHSSLQEDPNGPLPQWSDAAATAPHEHNIDYFQEADLALLTQTTTNHQVQPLPAPIHPISLSVDDATTIPEMEFSFESLMHNFPTPASETVATPAATTIQQDRVHSNNNSHIVFDCTQVISDLESYIVADLKSFKIVLSLVKRALEKVVELSDMLHDSHNARCVVLMVVVMHQTIELLEICFEILKNESISQRDAGFGLQLASSSLLPGLGSGNFSADVKEQNAWRSQMVHREVRQTMEVVSKLKRSTGEQSSSNGFQSRSRALWYEELELRLTDLIGRLSRR
jgi:hypothetical protein